MRATSSASLIHLGIKGTVVALDRRTGVEAWRTELKGSDFVNLVLDGDSLFAAARGEIFCLDPLSGHVRWNNELKGMGWGLVTIAGEPVAPMAQRHAEAARQATAAS